MLESEAALLLCLLILLRGAVDHPNTGRQPSIQEALANLTASQHSPWGGASSAHSRRAAHRCGVVPRRAYGAARTGEKRCFSRLHFSVVHPAATVPCASLLLGVGVAVDGTAKLMRTPLDQHDTCAELIRFTAMCSPSDSEECFGTSEVTLTGTHLAAQARTSVRLPRCHGVRLRCHLTRSRFFSVCFILPFVCACVCVSLTQRGRIAYPHHRLLAGSASTALKRMGTGDTKASEKPSDGVPLEGCRATMANPRCIRRLFPPLIHFCFCCVELRGAVACLLVLLVP